jgi:hypothetical protein
MWCRWLNGFYGLTHFPHEARVSAPSVSSGIWHLASGIWPLAAGRWYLASDICYGIG